MIGDGEAETGPTATYVQYFISLRIAAIPDWKSSWHIIKYLDPEESGAVLPILHVNGFKFSEPTIFGCMDNTEHTALLTRYGY